MIPAEAVEAAAEASYEQVRPRMGFPTGFDDAPEPLRQTYLDLARAALEAAAPHMLADDPRIDAIAAWCGRFRTGYYDEAQDDVMAILRPTT